VSGIFHQFICHNSTLISCWIWQQITINSVTPDVFKILPKKNTENIAAKFCTACSDTLVHILWKFDQNLRWSSWKHLLNWYGMTLCTSVLFPTVQLLGASIPTKPMMHIAYFPSPYFNKIYNFPLFWQNLLIFPYFRSIDIFCLIYVFLLPPYFDHDAFMHHALHVLDTSDSFPKT